MIFVWFAGFQAFVSVFLAKFFGKKLVVVAGGYDAAYVPEINYGVFTCWWRTIMAVFVYKNADVVLAVSQYTKRELIQRITPKKMIRCDKCGYALLADATVDVMVNTYNSERYLDACLKSIVKNIPVKTLWVIDKFSQDNTKQIALKYGARVVESDCSLAEARALGFRLVETPLFVNVDSDVVLCDGWFNKVMKYWKNDNIGALFGITIDQHPLQKAYTEAMFKIRPAISYTSVFRLPNAVFLTDAVKDIQFSNWLKVGSVANEDYEIKKWILKKGYKIVSAPVFSKHYSNPPLINNKTFWFGASMRLTKILSFKDLIFRTAFSLPQAIVTSFISNNARLVPYWVKYRFQILNGYLNWQKYFDFKRSISKHD